MAITIRARKGTQIGYKGTSGGSLSWVNQAGQAGRQMAALGNTIINSADDVSKIFDDEVSASEKKQQVDDLTVAYVKTMRNLQKDLQNGGFKLDANGIPEFELNPNYYTDISEQHHEKFWKDHVDGKDLDSEAVSAFGVYFQNKQQASFNDAATWGRTQRFTRLKAKDTTNLSALLLTIKTDKSIRNKNDAFDALNNIVQTGAPHRDSTEMKNVFIAAKKALIESSAIEIAFGQQGKNQVPSDMQNGYTAEDYTKAMVNISEHPILDRDQKKAIITNLELNRKTRINVEADIAAVADTKLHNAFSKLDRNNALTAEVVNSSGISEANRNYWLKILADETGDWKGDYDRINLKILSGTWKNSEDIIRTPELIKQEVLNEAQKSTMPSDEIEKLMDEVDEVAKKSPVTKAKESAFTHAREVFGQKLNFWQQLIINKGAKAGAFEKEIEAAKENRIHEFGKQLTIQLHEGIKDKKTWRQMLSPTLNGKDNPEYIVNEIIDKINKVTPEFIQVEQKKEESIFDNIVEGVVDFFSSDDEEDVVSGAENSMFSNAMKEGEGEDNIIHEIYGEEFTFQAGVTFEQAKAKVDSKYAAELHNGDITQRITYPESHKGYSQYPEGRETAQAFQERMRWMGLKIDRLGVYK